MENILLYVVIGAIVLAVVLGYNKPKTKSTTKTPKPTTRPTTTTLDNVAPSKASLQKLTKKQIDDTAAAQGVKLDGRETKAKMIDEFLKQSK
jgi:hypothetical protein|tara:strand:+ start:582 stop:857 length:276 start_codon:yes stop_codon:yes gene_type:complete